MCYNPSISLFTALVEFILAGMMLLKYRWASTRFFFAAFLVVLGAYQFTEFMLCKTNSPEAWAAVGFVVYTFLPALGLHGTIRCLGRKFNPFWLYILPVGFVLFSLSYPSFILISQCQAIFVTVRNSLFQVGGFQQTLLFALYNLYYAGFILLSCVLCLVDYKKEKNINRKKLLLIFPLSVVLMSFPTLILIVIFPALDLRVPSVLCHFALLLVLTGFAGVRLEEKYVKEGKV